MKKTYILFQISLKFVHWGLINNKWALVQVMAIHRSGDKPYLNQWGSRCMKLYGISRLQWVKPGLPQGRQHDSFSSINVVANIVSPFSHQEDKVHDLQTSPSAKSDEGPKVSYTDSLKKTNVKRNLSLRSNTKRHSSFKVNCHQISHRLLGSELIL